MFRHYHKDSSVTWDISLFLIADPSHVIGLYPNLLPEEFRNQLAYPDRLPDLEGIELEKGIFALIDYLTQVGVQFVSWGFFHVKWVWVSLCAVYWKILRVNKTQDGYYSLLESKHSINLSVAWDAIWMSHSGLFDKLSKCVSLHDVHILHYRYMNLNCIS